MIPPKTYYPLGIVSKGYYTMSTHSCQEKLFASAFAC
jgi:hypothetical protein